MVLFTLLVRLWVGNAVVVAAVVVGGVEAVVNGGILFVNEFNAKSKVPLIILLLLL